jgi:hypothetical protein
MRRARDRAVIWLIAFYALVGFTVELNWLLFYRTFPRRHDFLGRMWRFYSQGDRGYYDLVSGFETGLEGFHLLVTLPLLLVLLWGILRGSIWRFPLQLCVGSYCCYSVLLYLLAKHVTGYAEMPRHDVGSFLILYLANLPWLAGMGWLASDAAREISRVFRRVEGTTHAI